MNDPAARCNTRLVTVITLGILMTCPSRVLASGRGEPRWYFQAGASWLSTIDEIGNNAAIIFTREFGDDGIPFTGDPNELTACRLNRGNFYPEQDPFCDPRPDDVLDRELSIEETLAFNVGAGFLLTPRFALQLDAGWFQAEGPRLDVYLEETIPVANSAGVYATFVDHDTSMPTDVGTITQVPIAVTGIARFMPDKAFSLHCGIGAGFLFTDFDMDAATQSLNQRLDSLRIRQIGTEIGANITPYWAGVLMEDGRVPYAHSVSVEIDDGPFWQLTGGFEYQVTDVLELVFDARYVMTQESMRIDLEGEDQIDLITLPEALFRPDGSLYLYSPDANAPNPLCRESGGGAYGCFESTPDTRVDPEGLRNPLPGRDEPRPGVTCPASGDFNDDGQLDICYVSGLVSPLGRTSPIGMWVIQGGSVDLDYFTAGVFLRFNL